MPGQKRFGVEARAEDFAEVFPGGAGGFAGDALGGGFDLADGLDAQLAMQFVDGEPGDIVPEEIDAVAALGGLGVNRQFALNAGLQIGVSRAQVGDAVGSGDGLEVGVLSFVRDGEFHDAAPSTGGTRRGTAA